MTERRRNAGRLMDLTFECPNCRMIDHVDSLESASRALCRHCHESRDLAPGWFVDGSPAGCPFCASADLYIRKDFPQEVGLMIVLAGFATALVFWYHGMRSPAYVTLAAAVLADLALYRLMPDVLACYRCGGQIRGQGVNRLGRFRRYNPTIGERHRREPGQPEESTTGGITADSDGPIPASDADAS